MFKLRTTIITILLFTPFLSYGDLLCSSCHYRVAPKDYGNRIIIERDTKQITFQNNAGRIGRVNYSDKHYEISGSLGRDEMLLIAIDILLKMSGETE